MNKPFTVVVIGGGAAGFFGAITAKKANPKSTVILIEKTAQLLSKVRVSGGGRCNVTHSCFDSRKLAQHYPRGEKELIGPFSRFQPRDTVEWFESRGVRLKTEEDGRVFPITDDSQTIINCLLLEAQKLGVEIRLKQKLEEVIAKEGRFLLQIASQESLEVDRLLLATGSSPQGYAFAKSLGHTIQEPVPSLFTFNVPTSALIDLAGASIEDAEISIPGQPELIQRGPLLLTHWGFSGPAALKLSAWGARTFFEKKYAFELCINWLPSFSREQILRKLCSLRENNPQRILDNEVPFKLPKNLWRRFLDILELDGKKRVAEISNAEFNKLTDCLHASRYSVKGRTTYKEEFVTCGGVSLKEIDFKKMESRIRKGLFFAGEILDIDGVTGGFNFQNAWTTAWIAGNAMATGID